MAIVVENHQPVPLRPLEEVLAKIGPASPPVVIYIPELVMEEDSAYDGGADYEGWYWYDPLCDEFHAVDAPEWWPEPDEVDYKATVGRLLQPGERLVLTVEG